MRKVWTASELRGEYGLAAEWEAKMRNMPRMEREEFLKWSKETAPFHRVKKEFDVGYDIVGYYLG